MRATWHIVSPSVKSFLTLDCLGFWTPHPHHPRPHPLTLHFYLLTSTPTTPSLGHSACRLARHPIRRSRRMSWKRHIKQIKEIRTWNGSCLTMDGISWQGVPQACYRLICRASGLPIQATPGVQVCVILSNDILTDPIVQITVCTVRLYHRDFSSQIMLDSNINIQMNYWFAEMTNMDLITPLFDYIEVRVFLSFWTDLIDIQGSLYQKTWAPRGAETAQTLYNISRGWVTHNEVWYTILSHSAYAELWGPDERRLESVPNAYHHWSDRPWIWRPLDIPAWSCLGILHNGLTILLSIYLIRCWYATMSYTLFR